MNKEHEINNEVSSDTNLEMKRLFKIRKVQKNKKPEFNRYCHHKFKRLSKSWRRPRGLQSKQRRGVLGKGAVATVGYGSPALVKGLHPSGYDEYLIYNKEELSMISPEFEAIRIASCVGTKKKLEIIDKARELNIKILNSCLKKENQ